MANIIVTGGDGFIGSHLTDMLIADGHMVRIIDNLSAYGGKNLNSKAEHFKLSITDDAIWPIFDGMEYVFHLAALPRIQPSILNPREFHDTNVTGVLNVLMAARDAGVKRVIYSASSSVYGDQEALPLREEMKPNPKNPYAAQKLMGEIYCKIFSDLYNLDTVSLRYFNVYGPRQPETGAYATVIGIFLKQRYESLPMTIVPDGLQARDFTHVKDVARANVLAMKRAELFGGEVINIGTGREYTIRQVAEMIGGPTIFAPARNGEARITRADIVKAKKLLGWEPSISLANGISELKL